MTQKAAETATAAQQQLYHRIPRILNGEKHGGTATAKSSVKTYRGKITVIRSSIVVQVLLLPFQKAPCSSNIRVVSPFNIREIRGQRF